MVKSDWRRRFGLVLAGCLTCGCGGEPNPWNRCAVEGQVTLDGTPLATGTITFFPLETRGPAAGGEIVDGAYSIPEESGPVAGKNRIEIRSVQKTGRMVESPGAVESDGPYVEGMLVEEFADVVPKRYNTYSELERTVEGGELNALDFPLDSKDDPPPNAKRTSR